MDEILDFVTGFWTEIRLGTGPSKVGNWDLVPLHESRPLHKNNK